MFGHYVSYMLMLGHKNMQAYFCDSRYRMFHVEHLQTAGCNHIQTFEEFNWILPLTGQDDGEKKIEL